MRISIMASIEDILQNWNQEFSHSYPLTSRLLDEKIISSPHTVSSGSYSLYEADQYIGTIVLKYFAGNHDAYNNLAYIAFLFVAKAFRNQGYGKALLEDILCIVRNARKKRLYCGTDFDCLFSGVFVDNNPKTHMFFQKRNFEHTGTNYNLICRKKQILDSDSVIYRRMTCENEKQELLELIIGNFSYRWYYEVKQLSAEELVVAEIDERIIGFVRLSQPKFRKLGNSTNLYPLYNCLGGIGPLGVIPEHQKFGIGKNLVKYAVNVLFDMGCSEILVDWTGLIDFYKKCGFEEITNQFEIYQMIIKEELDG